MFVAETELLPDQNYPKRLLLLTALTDKWRHQGMRKNYCGILDLRVPSFVCLALSGLRPGFGGNSLVVFTRLSGYLLRLHTDVHRRSDGSTHYGLDDRYDQGRRHDTNQVRQNKHLASPMSLYGVFGPIEWNAGNLPGIRLRWWPLTTQAWTPSGRDLLPSRKSTHKLTGHDYST